METQGGLCSPPGGIPSLADYAPEIYQRYFSANPITWISTHQLESYNAFIFKELPELILAENPITILKEPIDAEKGIYKYKTEIYVGGEATSPETLGLDIGAPILTLDSGTTIRRMFPNDARIRDLTYAATFRADILVRLTFSYPSDPLGKEVAERDDPSRSRAPRRDTEPGQYRTQVKDLPFKNFNLFRLPILLRSKLCATYQAPKALLMEMGEDRNDAGGYFIVDGAEKVLITRQEQAFNSIYVAVKPPSDIKINTYASVICQNPVTKQTRRVALFRLHESGGVEEGAIRISIPFVKGAIPVFALFRALGVISDKEIVRMILPDTSSGLTGAMENTLIPSIHDAYPITSQSQAIEFIRTLTKGFIVEHVLNILHEHLFCHVPDQPLARAYYLAELIRKMIRVEMRLEPNTNRDDIRNQRLLPTGTLLGGLFSECWKDWKKAVRLKVDTTYNYNRTLYEDENFLNIFSAGNISNVLSSSVLNDSIMRGFRGKWGTNQYTIKSGVIQPLARISYLDAMSHIRRVVSDFDTSMKLVGPRQLNPSQIGYFCTSETPTGGHIGATKNLSILTAISIPCAADPLMMWLLSVGRVQAVAVATQAVRATAASVQINGGTIGFCIRPDALTRVLKLMKWTACLPPTTSISFNTAENVLRIYMDAGRPLRPLWHLGEGGKWSSMLAQTPLPKWRDLVCGTFALTANRGIYSPDFLDPLFEWEGDEHVTLEDYEVALAPFCGAIEYVDPYESNEAYISWYGSAEEHDDHTHAEIHPSTMMGLLASMIPFANHNQSPRNQLSCSQSKQAIGYYATNFANRFDTYGSMLAYGEGPLARPLIHDATGDGEMVYGTNVIFCINSFDGYNQDDGILFNKSSLQRGLFRSISLRSYKGVEEVDPISKVVYRIGNPKTILAWTDLKPGYDYSSLDEQGIIKKGAEIHDKSVLIGMYLTNPETGKVADASVIPTVFTQGRVDEVVVIHQANGMKLVHVRIMEERIPELGDKFCLTPDHEVLTANRGWQPIADVSLTDLVCCLDPKDNSISYQHPTNKVTFECDNEIMYNVESDHVSLKTTLNHKMWVKPNTGTQFQLLEAKDVYGKRMIYSTIGNNTLPEVNPESESLVPYTGKVHCIEVPSHIFYVRRNGIPVWTGNSSKHGQKGTMGMMINAEDMPRTAEGMVPDIMVNPHCIPSRMTIAQLLEQLFGKLGAIMGAKMNATAFMNEPDSYKSIGDALETLGFQRDGEEILYSGTSGKMFTSSVFMGPLYFMRLKHLTQDKLNARGKGRKEIRTHQPTGGRGNEGGMRIGEMERDSLLGHGVTEFLHESMMKRSDGDILWICNGCGTIPIYNESQSLFVCPLCDGPLSYQGETVDTLGLVLPVKKSRATFSRIEVPYALKLLEQELTTFANISFRFLTAKNMRSFRSLPDLLEEDVEEPAEPTTLMDTLVNTILPPVAEATPADQVNVIKLESAPAAALPNGPVANSAAPIPTPLVGNLAIPTPAPIPSMTGGAERPPTPVGIDAMYDFMPEGPAKNAALRRASAPVVPVAPVVPDAQQGVTQPQAQPQAQPQPQAPITLIVNTTAAPEKEDSAPEPRAPVVAAPSLSIGSLPVVANGEIAPVPESDIKIVQVDQPV